MYIMLVIRSGEPFDHKEICEMKSGIRAVIIAGLRVRWSLCISAS
jgi:hypothetical protein